MKYHLLMRTKLIAGDGWLQGLLDGADYQRPNETGKPLPDCLGVLWPAHSSQSSELGTSRMRTQHFPDLVGFSARWYEFDEHGVVEDLRVISDKDAAKIELVDELINELQTRKRVLLAEAFIGGKPVTKAQAKKWPRKG